MITAIGQSGQVRNTGGDRTRPVEPAAPSGNRAGHSDAAPGGEASRRTALVPIEPAARRRPAGTVWLNRPSAPFLAQMIATKNDLPQTRARRRASQAEATAAYGTTTATLRAARIGERIAVSS